MDGEVVIGLNLDTKSFDAQIAATERKLENLQDEYELASKEGTFNKNSDGAIRLRKEIEECTNKLIRLRQEQEKLDSGGTYDNIKQKLEDMGKNTEKNTKKVAKWALAIFGIRSAYMFVRSAINSLAQSDPQLKADIDYIKAALASAIEPLVRGIVNLVRLLLTYIAYIIKAWTGKNIFENANKNLKSANKQAQNLQKTLAGFDEMNVLSDTSSGGGAGETTVAPSFDLSNIENIEVPGWIKWIAENKEIVIGAIVGIAGALTLIKLGDLIDGVSKLKEKLTPLGKWISKNGKTIAGAILIAEGIILIIRGVCQYLEDPSWNNFLIILLGVAAAAGGVLLIFGGIPALITLIIGLVAAIGLAIYKNWNKIKEVVGSIANWIYEHLIKPVINFFKGLWDLIKEGVQLLWNGIVGILSGVAHWVKQKVIDPIADFFTGLWDGIKKTFTDTWDFIVGSFSKGGKIFTGLVDGIVGVFKTVVNALIDGINWVIALPFKGINKLLNFIRNINILGARPFHELWGENPVPVPEIPKLAKGGIINQPGRGVAIGGERGMEGVIPLTDAQQMELLGEAIGKYITINNQVSNYMDGRLISRSLQRVQNKSDFAFNR